MREWIDVFKRGLSIDNPLTVLMIGLCATLAVSTKFEGAFFMGLAVIFVTTASTAIVSIVRQVIPERVRIPVFIVIIASFVTIVDLTMKAFLPDVYVFLGVWIPLIVVNCMILGRAEAFAYRNRLRLTTADGLGMGLGFAIVIIVLAFVREVIGAGSLDFLGVRLFTMPGWYRAPSIVLLFPGAFIVFGFIVALMAAMNRRLGRRVVQTAASCTIEEGGR